MSDYQCFGTSDGIYKCMYDISCVIELFKWGEWSVSHGEQIVCWRKLKICIHTIMYIQNIINTPEVIRTNKYLVKICQF